MKERPIIFSGPMIPAILDDRKTMTRRVIKPQPEPSSDKRKAWRWAYRDGRRIRLGPRRLVAGSLETLLESMAEFCPYGVPGDRLWVREAWRFLGTNMNRLGRTHHRQDGVFEYRADGETRTIERPWQDIEYYMTGFACREMWRPSIHMRRWISRILLEVTSVRVERVQDISPEDALAEGIQLPDGCEFIDHRPEMVMQFGNLWDSLNAKPKPCHDPNLYPGRPVPYYISYPWEDIQETREHRGKPWYVCGNPWVWPITFKRLADIASLRRGSG